MMRPGEMAEDPRLARRMATIRPFHVMRLLARARQLESDGRSIVHMEIGEPDFPTPEPIEQAARRALTARATHYTPAAGLPALRAAIADHYLRQFAVAVNPARVLVTPGASGALQLALGVLIDPGDRVLMADPGYPCNRHLVRLFEGQPLPVPVGPETGYQLSPAMVEAAWSERARAVMVATPSNPTGTTMRQGELAALQRMVTARGATLVVDEIYQSLVYDQAPATVLRVSDEALVINSFSKYFGMTGWRLGWIVAPEAYVEAMDRLAQNIFLAAPTLSQHAALAAFTPETLAELEARRREFQTRRDYLLPALSELGFRIECRPQGAFYLYADCSAHSDDSFALAEVLLERAGVAVTPGLDFGDHRPERHLRFAYTTDLPRLQEGVERMRGFFAAGS
jgi:aspartate/methionine/tyrosine aminotransferase